MKKGIKYSEEQIFKISFFYLKEKLSLQIASLVSNPLRHSKFDCIKMKYFAILFGFQIIKIKLILNIAIFFEIKVFNFDFELKFIFI